MPAIALEPLAASIKKSLGVRGGIRVMGDARTRVRTIGLLPGSTPIQAALRMLPGVDAIVAGEVREWETVEYVRDTLTTGRMKGLILIGRLVSEDPGMKVCADWLNTIVPEVRADRDPGRRSLLEAALMPTITAGEIIDRVKANLGAPWRDATYRDTFKFGGPDTKVTGIATTAFASLDVIQRAVKAGLNMIVPHEVTWWNDRDDTTIVQDDAVYKAKVDFMRQHDVVVFRMHDHMHVQRPDFTYVGSARTLGLDSKDETAPNSHRFVVPETTLGALAADFQKRLGAKALRVVGDPNAKVRRIQLGVGYATPMISQPTST